MPGNDDDRQFETQVPGQEGDFAQLGQEGDYAQLLDDYSHFAPPSEGEIYKGTVLSVTDKEVIVDFGYKSEGLVPIEQLRAADGTVRVKPGDVIDVMMDRSAERPEGYTLLSH